MAKAKRDTTAAVVSGQSTDLGARMEGARLSGGGIESGGNAAAAQSLGDPGAQVIGAVKRAGRAVVKAITPGAANAAIGNSAMDRHNARAAEFALSEAERAKQLKRLDANIASDKAARRK